MTIWLLVFPSLVAIGWLEHDGQAWLERWVYKRHFED